MKTGVRMTQDTTQLRLSAGLALLAICVELLYVFFIEFSEPFVVAHLSIRIRICTKANSLLKNL